MSDSRMCSPPPTPTTGIASFKLTSDHLCLYAILYIRQSTLQQLRDHHESTQRQYQLRERLTAFGWPDERIVIIDDDLGVSGSGQVERPGFKRMLQLVTDGQVGLVLGLEMSRLARNFKDWHDLFEVCAIFETLIADEDGVFDPNDPNDRLVLGLKGIISEMELHTMKVRLERGRLNKAQRGELFHHIPVGFVRDEAGLPQLDPDQSARHAIEMFFRLFESLGSSNKLFHYLAKQDIKLPFRDSHGQLDWRVPAISTVYEMLKHPLYTGTYAYGRTKNYRQKHRGKPVKRSKKHLPPHQWKVFLRDRFPSYISWEQYENNQRTLRHNDSRGGERGPARGGPGLLTGIVYCARCKRRLSPIFRADGGGSYHCSRHHTVGDTASCQNTIARRTLDALIANKVLQALQPSAVELSLQVIEDEAARREQLERLHTDRVKQAQYAVDLAQRRYQAVDPANRLVAGTLEQQWEAALTDLQTAQEQLDELRQSQSVQLSDEERTQLVQSSVDVATLFDSQASNEERQQITRLLIERIEIDVHNNTDSVSIVIHWSGGFQSCHETTKPVMRYDQLESYDDLIERAIALAMEGKRSPEVAAALEKEGFRTPRRHQRISTSMVQKLLASSACACQLHDPELKPGHWRSADLAKELGIPQKRLKDWVTQGRATAIQRPFGRTWVIFADTEELDRLRRLVRSQTGQDVPLSSKNVRPPK